MESVKEELTGMFISQTLQQKGFKEIYISHDEVMYEKDDIIIKAERKDIEEMEED